MRMCDWPSLCPGAIIDIIAPSGRFDAAVLAEIARFLQQHGFVARLPDNLLGKHDFLANTDSARLHQLQQALLAPDSELIWCVRGGHGTTRLMKELMRMPKPKKPKLMVGFSDITTLHVFVNQHWHWPSLHAPMARQVALGESDRQDIHTLLQLWRQGLSAYRLDGFVALNAHAQKSQRLIGISAGTCLSLLQTSLATPWQLDPVNKILFIEDVNEQPYRLDRLLTHLSNAGIWSKAQAIVLGDFGQSFSESQQQALQRVLMEFAMSQTIPVFQLAGFGHGPRNHPLPLGVEAQLQAIHEDFQLSFS